MAESSLSITWQEHQARVGTFLGWGRGAVYGDVAWSAPQQFEIDGVVASGLRRFYFPQPLEGEAVPHKWGFLRPTATLDLPQGPATGPQLIPLPDDYGGFEGQITVLTAATTAAPWRIEWTSEPFVREQYQVFPTRTGPPECAAPVPVKGTGPTAGQRFELIVFPLADQDYRLQVQYYVNPDYLSAPFPYAYGGAPHAETILESCLSVAEERLDDTPTLQGPHGQAYLKRLAASVAVDRTQKPQRLGYNRDRSDDRDTVWNPHYWAPAATYNGRSFGA